MSHLEQLIKTAADLPTYLECVKPFIKQYYMLIVIARGTPWEPLFAREYIHVFMSLGFQTDLYQKSNLSYAAALYDGQAIEKIAATTAEAVELKIKINGASLALGSAGRNVPRTSKGYASLSVDGKEYSSTQNGLTFVLFDPVAKKIADTVNFNVSKSLAATRLWYNLIELLPDGFLEDARRQYPGVHFLFVTHTEFPDEHLSDNEIFLRDNVIDEAVLQNSTDKPVSILNRHFETPAEIAEVVDTTIPAYHDAFGVFRYEDRHGKHVNIAGGHRVTVGQPPTWARSIYMLGASRVFGFGVSDQDTCASHLQKMLNDRVPEHKWIVQNYGYYIFGAEGTEIPKILDALPVKPGDIVLVTVHDYKELPPASIDLRSLFHRPHPYGEMYFDSGGHPTGNGYRIIADRIFTELQKRRFLSEATTLPPPPPQNTDEENHDADGQDILSELACYKKILSDHYRDLFKTGAIVVNCNPFTLGHRYLIEQAASRCRHLMVFVVQEDLSEFPFEDRLRLIYAAIEDIDNVSLIPSGRFIISSLTFREYFHKSELQDRTIDTSLDITIFAREIAPCLNIRIRFAGEEPNDAVTRQYNDCMRILLPAYGIEFKEIERMEIDGIPVSASRVRALLKKRDFDSIEKLVPKSTLDYLKNRFSDKCGF